MGTLFRPDQVIAERYQLERLLGTGAAAEVWSAHDRTLHAPVALKLLNPGYAGSDVASRFLREARAAAQLRSLHVVQILDQGLHDGSPYIAMELLEGETLADRLDRERRLGPAATSRIVGHVAKAAGKAHAAGIVHRDLKPPNIFLVRAEDEGEEDEIAKVFDFGIAKIKTPPRASASTATTTVGMLLGTPEYMSPEQAVGEPADFRSDLYAIGIIAFECVTGAIPFRTYDVAELLEHAASGTLLRPSEVADVPPGFDAWFAKATSFRPDDRFASARELADALREVLG